MKNTTKKLRKVIALVIAMAVLFASFPVITGFAAENNSAYEKVSDPSTLNKWTEFFGAQGSDTTNAGGVWTDKSVFSNNSDPAFQNLTDYYGDPIKPEVEENSFLVALSAIASNKSIVGYSNIPTDTVLVLDVSGSMGPKIGAANDYLRQDAVRELVMAANMAITELLALNEHNRVGIVLYSQDSSTLFDIDRYSAANTVTYDNGTPNDTTDDIKYSQYLVTNNNRNIIQIASNVKNSGNTTISRTSVNVTGGTYIQLGLNQAASLFKARHDGNDTTIKEQDFQAGAQRKPVVVLMSDGAPTYGNTDYRTFQNNRTGNGSSSSAKLAFLTQLTAAYAKENITSYYNDSEALFYTLGLGTRNDTNATSVLNPDSSQNTTNSFWNTYLAAQNNSSVSLGSSNDRFSVTRDTTVTSKSYVDSAFTADSASELFSAFQSIVREIIIQSLYRPTLVEENNAHMGGYIEFIDDIGEYMKIKEIEGIMIGNKLFTGEKLQENFTENGGALGTVQTPNELGNNLIWAVQKRLNLTSVQQARDLVSQAYNHGQLSATSNFIGWYGDENNNFLAFWDESHTYEKMPQGAKYCNKSYGMLGEYKDGMNESDLMYASIQVHTEIVPVDPSHGIEETDVIFPGHCQLIFRLPSSLIPVVSYNISLEGTNYDNATNIEMDISDASPIRLLFEVGLRSDLDEYNVATLDDNNYNPTTGKYEFYTNDFDFDQYYREIDTNENNHIYPSEAVNTVAYFEPNTSNERYYYTEPTMVWVKNGSNYTKYNSVSKPEANDGNEYYRQGRIFKYTEDSTDGNAAYIDYYYEAISAESIGKVTNSEDVGYWVIPAGVVHRTVDETNVLKGSNPTGTIPVSNFPTVEKHTENNVNFYYANAIHGNNGKLTVTPATGLKISKTVDASLIGTAEVFSFNITVADASGDYTLVIDRANGTRETGTITFTSGTATLELNAGDVAYISGLEYDKNYTVSEVTDSKPYTVSSSSGTSGTIAQYKLSDVRFENKLREDGYLVISKTVTHPFAAAPESLSDKEFNFEITLENTSATIAEATFTGSTTPTTLNIVDGKINLSLKADHAVRIKLPEGTVVNVSEKTSPSGFTLDEGNSVIPTDAVIANNHNTNFSFVNEYNPASANVDVDIEAEKNFTGRPWDNDDSFTFVLSRYNTTSAAYEEVARETVTTPDQADGSTATFGDELEKYFDTRDFKEVGTYHFMISEIVPEETKGITYDTMPKYFNVVVTDTDTDGKLEAVVTQVNRTTVTEVTKNTEYKVEAEFVNTYKASGIAEARIAILKEVVSTAGETYSPEGFEFQVYDVTGGKNEPLSTQNIITDENGNARFTLTYSSDGINYQNDAVYNYELREVDSQIGKMTYADPIPFTVTVKDNLDGTIVAETNISNFNSDNIPELLVENNYDPDDATTTISGTKTYVDVENEDITLSGGEFSFKMTPQGNAPAVSDASNKADGSFGFELTFDKVGEYEYKLTEVDGADQYIDYDDTEYKVVFTVEDDKNGTLSVTNTEITKGGNSVNAVTFKNQNTYDPDPINVALDVTKTLEGRDMEADEFEFTLTQVIEGTELRVVDAAGITAKNKAAKKGVASAVDFGNITIDEAGVYVFKISEAQGTKLGITYDTATITATVTVTDNGDETLSYNIVYGANGNNFKNKYEAKGDITIDGEKTLEGKTLEVGAFSFELLNSDAAKTEGSVIATETNKADGSFQFKLNYNLNDLGDNYYIIKEVNGGKYEILSSENKGIHYDAEKYLVKVSVTDNGDGTLKTVKEITKLSSNSPATTIEFKNTAEDILVKDVFSLEEPSITIDGKSVSVGEILTYSITYYNGNDETASVEITDTIPEGTSFLEGSQSGNGIYASGKIVWNIDVPSKSAQTVSFNVKVDDPGKDIQNKAVAVSSGNTFTSNEVVNYTYEKTVSHNSANLGDEVDYTITYKNNTGAAAEVIITDNLDDGLTFISAEGGTYDEGKHSVSWTFNSVAPNDTVTVSLKARIDKDAKDKIENTADIFINNVKVLTNTVETEIHRPKIVIEKAQSVNGGEETSEKTTAKIGDEIYYFITVRNEGDVDIANITVTDIVPEGLIFKGVDELGNRNDNVLTWNIPQLEAGKDITVSFIAEVPEIEEATVWKNVAAVSYDIDKDGENEEDTSNEVELIAEPEQPIEEEEEPIDDEPIEEDPKEEPKEEPTEAPKTGDTFNLSLLLALLLVSGIGLLSSLKKKKS